MNTAPGDNEAYRFPVSVKGVIIRDGCVVLVRNARGEWELPGGKLELDESPEQCVVREIEEELRLSVEADRLVDAWQYTVVPGTTVFVVTYGCTERQREDAAVSDEHCELRWIPLTDVVDLTMPDGYKRSIRSWAGIHGDQ